MSIDRISRLPDDVLTHILSFMSSKEAVKTCILSKRWTNTWASVPVLNIRCFDWFKKDRKFEQFVDYLLANQGPSKLNTVNYFEEFGYGSWTLSFKLLHHAARLMPRVITICIEGVNSYKFRVMLPNSLFSCASLEILKLSCSTTNRYNFNTFKFNGAILRPTLISLPSLKCLCLSRLWVNDDIAQMILMGCPSLQTIRLETCELWISRISCSALKELFLYDCLHFRDMQISCTGLNTFSITFPTHGCKSISLENTASPVNANIYFSGLCWTLAISDGPNLNLLSGLSNVTSLMLHYFDLPKFKRWENFQKYIRNCITFKNLKSLIIKHCDMLDDFDLIACFLKHSPVLQHLTVHLQLNERPQKSPGKMFSSNSSTLRWSPSIVRKRKK